MLATKESYVELFLLLLVIFNGSQGCLVGNLISKSVFIKTNDPFLKECSCDVTNSKNSAENLRWLDSSQREVGPRWGLEIEPNVYTERSLYSTTLYMPKASRELSGNYTCISRTNGATYVHVYPVEVYDPIQFINTKPDQNIVKGKDSLITCEALGYTQPEYHWHKDDEVIKFGNGEKYRRTAGGLIIRNVTEEDEGTYTCTASVDTTAETVSKYIKVSVFTPPEINDLVAVPQTTVVSRMSLVLDCTAEGNPAPEFSWMKVSNYEEYGDEKNISWHADKNKLIFKNIEEIDRGTYQCTAQNAAGVDRRNITIEVNTPPVIRSFENITGDEGNEGRLICSASGRPRPTVTVEYGTDDDRLENDVSIEFSYTNSSDTVADYELYFEHLKRNHAIFFNCIASNEVGTVSQLAKVSVNHKPYFDRKVETVYGWEGAIVRLTCEPDSQPPAHIVWSYKDTTLTNIGRKTEDGNQHLDIRIDKENPEYGEYTCTASNQLGTETKYINLVEGFVPMKIYNVTLSDIKASTVKVTFEKPVSGPNITSYVAEYDEADIYRVQSIHQNRTWAPDIEYRLEKLKPGTEYLIRVAATNGVGTGDYSDLVEFKTPRKSAPEMPNYEALTPLPAERKVELKLIRPDDNGDPIDYYHIIYCPVIDFGTGEINKTLCKYVSAPANQGKMELTNMENSETYLIQLVAHNSEGNSPANTFKFFMPADPSSDSPLSAGAIIGLAVVLVVLAILLLDLLLCATLKKGMIATCCLKKKKKKNITVNSRERKGLLRESRDADAVRPNNGHKEHENNKITGDNITGKHSEV